MNIIEEYENAKRNAEDEEAITQASEVTWDMLNNHLARHNRSTKPELSTYCHVHALARKQPFVFKNKDTLLAPFTVRTTVDAECNNDGWQPITPITFIRLAHPRGGDMTLRLMPPIEPTGDRAGSVKQGVDLGSLISSEEGLKQLTTMLPDLPPSVFDSKTMRGFRPVEATLQYPSYSHHIPVACAGRPVATINKWLKRYELPPLDTATTNLWLSQIDSILAVKQYTAEWIPDGTCISEVYSDWEADEEIDLGSCMSGKDYTYFALYDDLQRAGRLSMMLIKINGAHCGRALVWHDNGQYYLDRVYCVRINSCHPQKAIDAVRQFLRDENIVKCVYHTDGFANDLSHRLLSIPTPSTLCVYDNVPYIDSLRHWYVDGMLSNRDDRPCHKLSELDNTDGSLNVEEPERMVEDIFGEEIEESQAVYVFYYDGYVRSGDTTLSTRDGRIHDDHLVYLSPLHYTRESCHMDNAIMTADEQMVLVDDSVTLADGRVFHHSLTRTEDNEIVLICGNTEADA